MSVFDEGLKSLFNVYRFLFSDGLEVSGYPTLPAGPKIIAANHTNGSDPLYLPFLTKEKVHCLFQNGLYAIPVLGWLLKKTDQICVDRANGRPAYDRACSLLKQGATVAIFPEGRLVRREARIKAKSGVVRMALETGVPIIPLGFYVRQQDLITMQIPWNDNIPPGDWQIAGKCYARFGEPWLPSPDEPIATQTEELMERIYALVDQLEHEEALCASPISPNLIRQW
jgi:1-acyl-sn-glycerol-3-phosphate acyltransferase